MHRILEKQCFFEYVCLALRHSFYRINEEMNSINRAEDVEYHIVKTSKPKNVTVDARLFAWCMIPFNGQCRPQRAMIDNGRRPVSRISPQGESAHRQLRALTKEN